MMEHKEAKVFVATLKPGAKIEEVDLTEFLASRPGKRALKTLRKAAERVEKSNAPKKS
jgi:hypothetical protein